MNNTLTANGDILVPPIECDEEGCTSPDPERCKDCRWQWEPWFTMKIKNEDEFRLSGGIHGL